MYSNYGINYKSKIRLKNITTLLIDAHTKELEEKLWQQWLIDYGRMDDTNFISFEKYKEDTFRVVDNSTLDKEAIIKDAEEIKKLDQEARKLETPI